jgi:hypothetical protein
MRDSAIGCVFAAVLCAGALPACDSETTAGPCSGISCSGRGFCLAEQGIPQCACIAGFHPEGLACAPDDPGDPCAGVDCTGHGGCLVVAGNAECVCDPGYHHPSDYPVHCVPDDLDGGTDGGPCTPTGPESCNLVDDDCDGLTDEDFDLDFHSAHCGRCGLSCGAREHAAGACVLGDCDLICEPGWADLDHDPRNGCEGVCDPAATPDETLCDGRDDDCDGLTDEDWASPADCGVGACTRATVCHRGETECRPRTPPAATDETCDRIDDDCDGLTDDECGTPFCGDGMTGLGEECDDGNDEDGDGCDGDCTFSCLDDGDCDDANPCTGDACVPVAAGRRCELTVNTEDECDDGLFCNGRDSCDADGACTDHAGDPCAGSCVTCVEAGDDCSVAADSCWIAAACYAVGDANPANQCERCWPAADPRAWSKLPDFGRCSLLTIPDRSYDICVDGACVSPGCGDLACNAPGPDWTLPDTNQRDCYDAVGPVACPGTAGAAGCAATPYCGQDAQYGWDTGHAAAERYTRTGTVEPVVADRVTGLIWQGCAAGQTGAGCLGTAALPEWTAAVAYCDSLVWGGWPDWVLPDAFQLRSLVDHGVAAAPTIDLSAFPGTESAEYWTATQAFLPLTVNFTTGLLDWGESGGSPVRCVQAHYAPGDASGGPRYDRSEPVAGQPVVRDHATGLDWQGCTAGLAGPTCELGSSTPADWPGALSYCEALDWGGSDDWFLPNTRELGSIANGRRGMPAVDWVAFPNTPAAACWSSTTTAMLPGQALCFEFAYSAVIGEDKTSTAHIRCARREP